MRDILKQFQKELEFSNAEDAEMFEMAEYYDNLDAEDFDDFDAEEAEAYEEFLEMLEMAERRKHGHHAHRSHGHHAHRKHGHHAHRSHGHHAHKGHGHHAHKAHGHSKHGAHTAMAMTAIGAGGYAASQKGTSKAPPAFGGADYVHDVMTRGDGDLNITVTRASNNIAGIPLPYILFNFNGFASSFISTLKQYLPTGVTVSASSDPANGDMLLTYVAPGPLTDIVRVSLTGSQISYMEFLQNMTSNFFMTNFIRQEYPNDSNLLLAVSQTIRFGLLSAMGAKSENNLLPRARRLTSDYQTFIINLFLPEQKVTTDFSFVQNIIGVANYTIAWDVFFSKRTNLNKTL